MATFFYTNNTRRYVSSCSERTWGHLQAISLRERINSSSHAIIRVQR